MGVMTHDSKWRSFYLTLHLQHQYRVLCTHRWETIPVTNDNVHQTSPVLIATITLMQYKYIGNQLGTIGSDKHSITMVTINDDDGETKSSL